MHRERERRLLQIAIGLACLVPLGVGGAGVLNSAAMLNGVAHPPPTDLDSHFRYLSGLLVGLGLAFAACIPAIERRGTAFRLLALPAVVGGLARLFSLLQLGSPSAGHLFALAMELGVVPVLAFGQWQVERRFRKS